MHTLLSIAATGSLISMLAMAAFPSSVFAQSTAGTAYPVKPIRLIVPFPPGGAVDAIGGIIGQKLGETFGPNVGNEHHGGAAGAIGAGLAGHSPPGW